MQEHEPQPLYSQTQPNSPATEVVLKGIDDGTITNEEALFAIGRALMRHTQLLDSVNQKLEHNGITDDLTGLLNREGIYEKLNEILQLPEEIRKKFVVLFIDLDNFKEINDSKGHARGDEVLAVVAEALEVRENDIVGRLGGDEFIVILDPEAEVHERRERERGEAPPRRDTKKARGEKVTGAIERIRKAIEEASLQCGEILSASIGAIDINGRETLAEILDVSDEAMYEDKRYKYDRLLHLKRKKHEALRKVMYETADLEEPGNEAEIMELVNLDKKLQAKNIVRELPKTTKIKTVEFGGAKFRALDMKHEQLENFLHNIGLVASNSEELQAESLRRSGFTKELFDTLFATEYPAIAERIKVLATQRVNLDDGLRNKIVEPEDKKEWFKANSAEIEVLTSYVYWKIADQLKQDGVPLPL